MHWTSRAHCKFHAMQSLAVNSIPWIVATLPPSENVSVGLVVVQWALVRNLVGY